MPRDEHFERMLNSLLDARAAIEEYNGQVDPGDRITHKVQTVPNLAQHIYTSRMQEEAMNPPDSEPGKTFG